MVAAMAERLVDFGRESVLATGRAGERSGACRIQQGCWFPHGMVSGGSVASTSGAVGRRERGQQSCSCADTDSVVVEREGQRNAKEEAASVMLQQIVEVTISAATILFRMSSATLCRVCQKRRTRTVTEITNSSEPVLC
jgi:hypothetical protein